MWLLENFKYCVGHIFLVDSTAQEYESEAATWRPALPYQRFLLTLLTEEVTLHFCVGIEFERIHTQ